MEVYENPVVLPKETIKNLSQLSPEDLTKIPRKHVILDDVEVITGYSIDYLILKFKNEVSYIFKRQSRFTRKNENFNSI
jgi:hypothetical protein